MNEFGIDTAFEWKIDPTSARKSELSYALPRLGTIGYGGITTDRWYNKPLNADSGFLPTIQNMQAAGKPVGCYIFSYAWDTNSALHEADKACNLLDSLGVSLELPVFFDWEEDSFNRAVAAGVRVTPNLVKQMTSTFMNYVRTRGRRAGWYSNKDFCERFYDGATRELWRFKENNIFWYAEWGISQPQLDCDVWQFDGTYQNHDVFWNGIRCDKNYVRNERFFDGKPIPPPHTKIPVWLLAHLTADVERSYKSHVI